MKLKICHGSEIRACLLLLNILTLMSICVLMVYVQNLNQTQSLKDPSEARKDTHDWFGQLELTVNLSNVTFSRIRRQKPGKDVKLYNVDYASKETRGARNFLRADSQMGKQDTTQELRTEEAQNEAFIKKSRKKGSRINFKRSIQKSVAREKTDIASNRAKRTETVFSVRRSNKKIPRPVQSFRKSAEATHILPFRTLKPNTERRYGNTEEVTRNDLTMDNSVRTVKHQELQASFPQRILGAKEPEANIPLNYGGFQEIGDELQTYVFSAIYDDVTVPVIRVITLIRDLQNSNPNISFSCCYGNDVSKSFPGSLQYVPEPDWGYSYRSAFILCQVPKTQLPTTISIGKADGLHIKNMLRVIYPFKKRWRIIKCFSVLHSSFKDTMQLIQQIELSLLFGVEHFVTYIRDVHPSLMKVLQMYEKIGILDIIRWNLPLNNSEIHYHGQMAVLQECLYRHLHVTDFILTGDTDELFVPKMNISVLETIEENLKDRSFCSALVLRQTFFPLNLPPYSDPFPAKPEVQKLKLTFLLQTTHLKVLDPDVRSKLIIKPTGVEILGIHTVKKYRRGQGGCVCPSNYCLLNHYRKIAPNDLGSYRITDTFLHNYSGAVVRRIKDRLDNLTIT